MKDKAMTTEDIAKFWLKKESDNIPESKNIAMMIMGCGIDRLDNDHPKYIAFKKISDASSELMKAYREMANIYCNQFQQENNNG